MVDLADKVDVCGRASLGVKINMLKGSRQTLGICHPCPQQVLCINYEHAAMLFQLEEVSACGSTAKMSAVHPVPILLQHREQA